MKNRMATLIKSARQKILYFIGDTGAMLCVLGVRIHSLGDSIIDWEYKRLRSLHKL